MADLCTAGSTYVRVPFDGVLERIDLVTYADVTTGDNTSTFKLNGVALTGASIVVDHDLASSVGVAHSDTGQLSVKEGDILEHVSDGAGSGTVPCHVQYTIRKLTAL